MKTIEPTYVSFEQAKWLKEKGFDTPCNRHCFIGNTGKIVFETSVHCIDWGNRPTIKTVQKYSAPEQWQVVEWVLQKYGVWIEVNLPLYEDFRFTLIDVNKKLLLKLSDEFYETPQKAYSAAFDYILKHLI